MSVLEGVADNLKEGVTLSAREVLMRRIVLTVERYAKQAAPVQTGTLRRSITSRIEVTSTGARGFVGTNIAYARAVHEGTRPHIIKAKNKRVLRFMVAGRATYRKQVRHPGTKPRPFLAESLVASRDTIGKLLADAGEELAARIAK